MQRRRFKDLTPRACICGRVRCCWPTCVKRGINVIWRRCAGTRRSAPLCCSLSSEVSSLRRELTSAGAHCSETLRYPGSTACKEVGQASQKKTEKIRENSWVDAATDARPQVRRLRSHASMFRVAIFAVCVRTGGLALHGLRTENRAARNARARAKRNRAAQNQEREGIVRLESSAWND